MKKIIAVMLAGSVLAMSCKKDNNGKNGIYKGAEVQVHSGKAWTWTQLKNDGTPERIAITINDAAFNSVKMDHPGGDGHDMTMSMFVLPLHAKAGVTPFNHIGLDWNPTGHEPSGIYDLPHFDFHYYMISETERATIPLYETDSLKFKNYPATTYFPPTYIAGPGGVPQMGTHWLDVTSPELGSGQKFTQTFIYGSYNGKVTFMEPMITWDFLKNTTTFTRAIPQPAKFQKTGHYPTKMRISKHDGVIDIILEDFIYRQQS